MRIGTMTRTGSLAALAVSGALLGSLLAWHDVSAGTPAVAIDSIHVGPEDVAKLDLRALDLVEPGLGAWTVDIHYSPEHLNVAGCEAEHGGVCNPHFGDGVIRVVGTNLEGITGDTVLASIGITCKAPGESTLELAIDVFADATPGDPTEMDVSLVNGTAVCTEEAQPTPTPTPKPHEQLPGDVDCDGDIDAIDAVLVLQYSAALIDGLECLKNADLNEDDSINALDASFILQMAAGLIS